METMDSTSFLGIPLLNEENFLFLLARFAFNIFVIYIIARLIYFRIRKNRSYLFTLFIFNIVVFFVCYLLNSLEISLGFAFGIFAIFSILRYRTTTIPIKDMTYMFISISVAIINALSNQQISYAELLFTNGMLILFAFLLEKLWVQNELRKNIIYEKIDLIKPENHDKLLEDLINRTGLNIHRFEIGRIDFMRDIARIRIYYYNENDTEYDETELYDIDD